jgi:hypothetical protein
MLRDPTHVLISNGVGNANVCCLVKALKDYDITLPMMMNCISQLTLPCKFGKVDSNWMCRTQFGEKFESFASFVGIMPTLVPIIVAFLTEVVDPSHALDEHKQCFITLSRILGICFRGPDDSVRDDEVLRQLIHKYIDMFGRLYPKASTPKLHQLIHIPHNIEFLWKLLSCFVTERKHRTNKRAALFVVRHMDNAVITDMVNKQCDAVCGNVNSLFSNMFLVSPKEVTLAGMTFERAREAVLPCGMLRIDDLLYVATNIVDRAVCF